MCKNCINFIYDNITGQADCKQFENMTEEQTEKYFTNDTEGCPYKTDNKIVIYCEGCTKLYKVDEVPKCCPYCGNGQKENEEE